jgi:parallel beta-helix repeat protein
MPKLYLFCFFLACFASRHASATDYYLSADGNDANSGTSAASPWRTLAKLSAELGGPNGTWSTTFNSGDRIFFRRGDTFRGEIYFSAFNNQGITFGAYGAGADPIIKGSKVISGWTVHSGNIWRANVADTIHMLFVYGAVQTLARYPNTGVLSTTAATTTSATGNGVSSSGLNFVGANICIREYEWRNNRQPVTSQSGNRVNWATAINAAPTGAYFYFDNKLDLLDVPGEWFYDRTAKVLYLMTDGTDPNTLFIEGSVNLLGLRGNDNRSNNTLRNLQFMHFAEYGIRLMGASNNNIIEQCTFKDNLQAIFLSGNDGSVSSNVIEDAFLQGIVTANSANTSIARNNIQRTGMIWGMHRPDFKGDFYPNAIYQINGTPGCVISENVISHSGYNGIKFIGNGIVVEKNQVSYSLLNMSDGGAIYTWGTGSYNCIVRNNFVDHVIGDYQGISPNGIALGIYIDNFANNIQILNNTVTDIPVGGGIVINAGSHNCLIQGNVVYRCNTALSFADWMAGQSVYSNVSRHNVLYANVPGGVPLEIASDDNNYNTMSISDSNYLKNIYDSVVVRYIWSNPQTFSRNQWTSATGFDANSISSFFNWLAPEDDSYILRNATSDTVDVPVSNTIDLNNATIGMVRIPPFSSVVLINFNLLPVELLYFTGSAKGLDHHFRWETASEFNTSHFDIQRLEEGQYRTQATITSKDRPATYTSTLFKVPSSHAVDGVHYYRLRIVDFDGQVEYSRIIAIDATEATSFALFPNPAQHLLRISSDYTGPLQIINPSGQVVTSITDFQNLVSIDISALAPGMYWVIGEGISQAFVKQ